MSSFNIVFLFFPEHRYRPALSDLKEVNPWVHHGLLKLTECQPGEVSSFALNFQASQEVFGAVQTVDLCPGGGERHVTAINRKEYIDLYIEWYLILSIQTQFSAFQRGFSRLCGGPILHIFRPEELEQLVCGSPNLDFNALESATVYEDGYDRSSSTICAFWRVVHAMSEEQKKLLLSFTTGSDRVPIKVRYKQPSVMSLNLDCSVL